MTNRDDAKAEAERKAGSGIGPKEWEATRREAVRANGTRPVRIPAGEKVAEGRMRVPGG
jgi:hypothetical protein